MRKYKNKPIVIDGIRFPSQKEGARYLALKEKQQRGEIASLEVHPVFRCEINGIKICKYIADSRYIDKRSNQTIVEDVKGYLTKEYKLKKKLVKALFNVDIVEV